MGKYFRDWKALRKLRQRLIAALDEACAASSAGASASHIKMIASIIASNTAVMDAYEDGNPGYTPLHYACHDRRVSLATSSRRSENNNMNNNDNATIMTPESNTMPTSSSSSAAAGGVVGLEIIQLLVNGPSPHHKRSSAVMTEDYHQRNLPLHYACCSPQAQVGVLALLVEAYPLSIRIKNTLGATPLHCAIQGRAPLAVIQWLVQKYPAALHCLDVNGDAPLHTMACLKQPSTESSKVMEFLFHSCPQVASWINKNGDTPLHEACRRLVSLGGGDYANGPTNTAVIETILFLTAQCPLATLLRSWDDGLTPLERVIKLQHQHHHHDDVEDGNSFQIIRHALETATREATCALVDIMLHTKKIDFPPTLIASMAQQVKELFKTKTSALTVVEAETETASSETNTDRSLMMEDHRVLVLDASLRTNLDRHWTHELLRNHYYDLQQLLLSPSMSLSQGSAVNEERYKNGYQELLHGHILMNRAGRLYFVDDPENKSQGIAVLLSVIDSVDCLFQHLRENPILCCLLRSEKAGMR